MESGDYIQYPEKEPFKVPDDYNEETDIEIRKEFFWERIMQPGLPFAFA